MSLNTACIGSMPFMVQSIRILSLYFHQELLFSCFMQLSYATNFPNALDKSAYGRKYLTRLTYQWSRHPQQNLGPYSVEYCSAEFLQVVPSNSEILCFKQLAFSMYSQFFWRQFPFDVLSYYWLHYLLHIWSIVYSSADQS